MTKYFNNCRTIEDVKQTYKQLVKELHPDNNINQDTTKAFQEMQAEYRVAFNRLKNVHVNAAGETYEKETTETAEEFADLINKLYKLNNIIIELCGSWLWITGNTKEHKEELKALGFRYASQKHAWYYHREPWHKKSKGTSSLDDIRFKYGSTIFNKTYSTSKDTDKLTA